MEPSPKKLPLGTNFAIFVMFFSLSVLHAFRSHDWLRALLWLAIAFLFLRADVQAAQRKTS